MTMEKAAGVGVANQLGSDALLDPGNDFAINVPSTLKAHGPQRRQVRTGPRAP